MNSLERLNKQKFLLWVPIVGASYFLFMLTLLIRKEKYINMNKFLLLNGVRVFLELLGFAIVLTLIFKKAEHIIIVEVLFSLWVNHLMIVLSLKLLKKINQAAYLKQQNVN